MRSLRKILATTALLCFSSAASAIPFIAFDEGPVLQTGTISYDGAGGPLIGADIEFITATGGDTPVMSGVPDALACINCLLNFETGGNVVEGPAAWVYNGGGALTLSGELWNGAVQIFSGNILDGVFTGAPTVIGGSTSALFAGAGTVQAADELQNYFGLSAFTFAFANTELALGTCSAFGDPGGFDCDLQNADLAVSATRVPVASSAALMLPFGLLLFRRKLQE